jgi:hypothetical protein
MGRDGESEYFMLEDRNRRGVVRFTRKLEEDDILAELLGFPPGTRIVSINHEFDRDDFEFFITGPWLKEVGVGMPSPEIKMRLESKYTHTIKYVQ